MPSREDFIQTDIGIVKVLLLGQQQGASFIECRKMLQQLSLLWKFRIDIPECRAVSTSVHTHAVISYSFQSAEFENWCLNTLDKESINQVLLIDNVPKSYGSALRRRFGVNGIEAAHAKGRLRIRTNENDPLMQGLPHEITAVHLPAETFGSISLSGASHLLSDRDNCCFMSKLKTNYCLSVPVWQFGVPTLPAVFLILRNFLFFSLGIGHLSPYPFVSLRIDDYPITSEQYLRTFGVSDEQRAQEINDLVRWSIQTGAKLEFMVSSMVLTERGEPLPIDQVVPKSCRLLKDYYDTHVIDINAHGRSHIDEKRYIKTKKITPLEFSHLSPQETEQHILDCTEFIERFFGKKSLGFVPPCWSYHEKVTKKVCGRFFSFVIDSSQNYRYGSDCLPMGSLDDNKMLHIVELWHLGSKNFNYCDPALWRVFLDCGIPVHMMAHGPYLSDPLPSRKASKLIVLALFVLFLPFVALVHPLDLLRSFKGLFSSVKWDRFGLIRKVLACLPFFRRASLHHLLQTGSWHAVQWVFTETLANHLREFTALDVTNYRRNGGQHIISFHLNNDCEGPFRFHLPQAAESAEIDGRPLSSIAAGRILILAHLAAGSHLLTIKLI